MTRDGRFGFIKPGVDAHVLGISSIGDLLADLGQEVAFAPEEVCRACDEPESPRGVQLIEEWLRNERVTRLGFSWRLGPEDGVQLFSRLVRQLERRSLFSDQGGPIRSLYFAGLPPACRLARERVARVDAVFDGEETPQESLARLGFRASALLQGSEDALRYDADRMGFGERLVRQGAYRELPRLERGGYPEYGGPGETVGHRLLHAGRRGQLPLYRAHMGQYLPDREEAVRRFLGDTRALAAGGQLDVLSIGTSQLTQSRFGEDWGTSVNGGGVPLNSRAELAETWQAARPMLVRSYAGTTNLPAMARINDETIHNAWHALSIWWFCRIDGRGPYSLRENLEQMVETLRYIGSAGKAFEPNVPHHFAFRGADEAAYVVSGYLAARLAKSQGVRELIIQNMLTTPKYTWGVQDLARSRVLLKLVRELEDRQFRALLETRAGLDYLSADPARAKAQLAAVTALMDDIEPHDPSSPQIIHVVSWTEATRLADPPVIAESVRICRQALLDYRRLRARGEVADMGASAEVSARAEELEAECRAIIAAIEKGIVSPFSPDGLYRIFAAGFLPVPYLWECRDELAGAVGWRTRLVRGAVRLVDDQGKPLSTERRIEKARATLLELPA